MNPGMIQNLEQPGQYAKFAEAEIYQVATPNPTGTGVVTADYASVAFYTIAGPDFAGYQSAYLPSLGSCIVRQGSPTTTSIPLPMTGLQAGDVSVEGPNGTRPLPNVGLGVYAANPLSGGYIPGSGGTFTFTGTAGTDVGAFSATAVVLPPLTWSNSASLGSIERTQPLTLYWHGGSGMDIVQIIGFAKSASGDFNTQFTCDSIDTGSFTVPAAVLQAMPAAAGILSVSSYMPPPQVFTATGLDFGFAVSYSRNEIDATYY
jgi:hypothetical protein